MARDVSRLWTVMGLCLVASLMMPSAAYPQATLAECQADFVIVIGAFETETDSATGGTRTGAQCIVTQGQAEVRAMGTADGSADTTRGLLAVYDRTAKGAGRCSNVLQRQESANIVKQKGLRKGVKTTWNKFLKGPACQQVMDLFP